eukprot:Nitzschia sp. Nitz4//scaffold47_size129522//74066//77969//NITZ4_003556-RA/size129522-snap-gene-0.199-mRNA-1//-1//CDS//3329552815//4381//frame0
MQDSNNAPLDLTLHDYLSLGEVYKGLTASVSQEGDARSSTATASESGNATLQVTSIADQEIQRLPILLRLLASTRHLASTDILDAFQLEQDTTRPASQDDALINKTVQELEQVAALHSFAESVDVTTNHLAPTMTKKLSRVVLVKRISETGETVYDTEELYRVAKNPKGSYQRSSGQRKRKSAGADKKSDGADGASDQEGSDSDQSSTTGFFQQDDEDGEAPPRKVPRSKSLQRKESMEVAAEDSQEATFVKTLSELVTLVSNSLEPIVAPDTDFDGNNNNEDDAQGNPSVQQQESQQGNTMDRQPKKGQLVLAVEDSILAESEQDVGQSIGGMEGSDTGAMVASLLHHAPALRSRQVAQALCRAIVPRLSILMTQLGANSPATVPALLSGCIEAYTMAFQHRNYHMVKKCTEAVMSLANLSPREKCRVQERLSTNRIMWDVQLELALLDTKNAAMALSLIVTQLSKSFSNKSLTSSGTSDRASSSHASPQSGGGTPMEDHDPSSEKFGLASNPDHSTLRWHLRDKPRLYKRSLEFFAGQFSELSHRRKLPRGQLVLTLRSFCWLLLVTPRPSTSSDLPDIMEKLVLPALQLLAEKAMELVLLSSQSELPQSSSMDTLLLLLHGALLLVSARILPEESLSETAKDACQELNVLLRQFPPVSRRVQGFCGNLQDAMFHDHWFALAGLVMHMLNPTPLVSTTLNSRSDPDFESGLRAVCDLMKPMSSDEHDDMDDLESKIVKTMFDIEYLDISSIASSVIDLLKRLLLDENSTIPSHLHGNMVSQYVAHATKALLDANCLLVPLVLASQLERTGSKLWDDLDGQQTQPLFSKFLLQLLHVFEFAEAQPESPFAFDSRAIPVKKALLEIKPPDVSSQQNFFLRDRLTELAERHCPDVIKQLERTELVSNFGSSDSSPAFSTSKKCKATIYKILRVFIEKGSGEAEEAESLFEHAKQHLQDAELYAITCSAFLALPHELRPSMTYYSICRDPLVLLKCPAKVWRRKGLRRVALTVLSAILEANTTIVRSSKASETSKSEYIAARNCVVVRCLLSGLLVEGLPPIHCTMTTSFVRNIIQDHRGLVAAIVKQGVSENVLDWMIENVPEVASDADDLLLLLSDRNSLTPVERLVAADAVLRVAVIQGHYNENEASRMAHVALAQFVDSFFLVVGPVGVPVDALIADESGLDVTQVSRKAAFRMLSALQKVTGRRTQLRKECSVALQKLAGLCKSESTMSGVAGNVAGRRKNLLKEMYDMIMKASNAMAAVQEIYAIPSN